MEQSYNARCPAVKRLFREAQELREATEEYYAVPLEDNLFEWHFTVRGPPQTDFQGGVYHGRIIMPSEYPMKPPNIIFLTPNGRFEINKKICLSISGYHPETWQPSWSIRTALLAIVGFMPTPANGTIGSLDYSAEERGKLAKRSLEYKCPECGNISKLLKERTSDNEEFQREARQVLSQVAVTSKSDSISESDNTSNSESQTSESNDKSNISTKANTSNSNDTTALPTQTKEDSSSETTTTTSLNRSTNSRQDTDEGGSSPATTHHTTSTIPLSPPESSSFLNNFVLSAAVFLFVALLLRRLFLMDSDVSEEIEDILL